MVIPTFLFIFAHRNTKRVTLPETKVKQKDEITKINKEKIMETMNFSSEMETEQKVVELTANGVGFRVIGRKSIVIL